MILHCNNRPSIARSSEIKLVVQHAVTACRTVYFGLENRVPNGYERFCSCFCSSSCCYQMFDSLRICRPQAAADAARCSKHEPHRQAAGSIVPRPQTSDATWRAEMTCAFPGPDSYGLMFLFINWSHWFVPRCNKFVCLCWNFWQTEQLFFTQLL